ncbi:MAG: DUF4097 domain-containing protein [Bacteroidota bacterium]|nr:DUF4097 domain-containing protein [Bacteroidota bacterium]
MEKYLLGLFLATAFFTVKAQSDSNKQPYEVKEFSGQTIRNVVSETSGGNVIVSAASQSESKVEVFVNQNSNRRNALSNDEIKTRIDADYDVEVSVKSGELTATAKLKHKMNDWKNSLSISFKIYVPENVSTKLSTSGGNIVLTGISGSQDFSTSGGNLDLNKLSGKIKGRTSGGNISINNCKDELNLSTSGGNIQAQNSSGNIDVSTSGGSIQLSNLDGKIKAGTSGGNVEGESISGDLSASTSGGNVSLQKMNCSLKASTSGGNIDVSVTTAGKFISIHNSAGKIRLRVPKKAGMDLKMNAMKISTENLENFVGKNEKDEVTGTVNGGGIPVTVDAGSGRIDLILD